MSSGSDSDSVSHRSHSPSVPARTPGYGLDRSRSNSIDGENKSQNEGSDRSRSASPSRRSGSVASQKSYGSNSNKSGSRDRSGSNSPVSQRSRSVGSEHSKKSRSRSNSAASDRSNRSGSHRSGSVVSNKSRSPVSPKSRSQSAGSNRSRSRSKSSDSNRSRSRSKSAASNRSRSKSGDSERSRSKSRASNRSRSRSKSITSNRSRSKSVDSERSRSKSRTSNRSRSRSKSVTSNRSRSQSRSSKSRSRSQTPDQKNASQDNSRSNSPNLEIAEPGSPGNEKGEKRKRSGSEESDVQKKKPVIASDSENEDKNEQPADAADLFGDADDISSEDDKEKSESEKETDRRRSDKEDKEDRHSGDENERLALGDDEDKENEPEPIPETRIDVEIPKISCDLGRDIHFVKLPNFLSVETRPFDQETYEDEIDEEETLDEEGRARLKLKVENTIRWREVIDKEGNAVKESNARFVRWSDGSYSLHLGSEIFDVYKQPLQGDHNHLFIRQGTGLQGQAVFRTKLSFRPHSTESFTHRKMTLSLADRSQKTSGIKILSQVGVDPDQDRKTLLKKEEEKLRQTVRATKPRKRGEGPARTHGGSNVYREEEGSDEEGAISLNAIKKQYKSGAAAAVPNKGGAIYSSDEEGSDFEARRTRKLDKPKALKDSESSEESE